MKRENMLVKERERERHCVCDTAHESLRETERKWKEEREMCVGGRVCGSLSD